MKRNYDPFAKTYQYLCYQEHLAHKKNIKNVTSQKQSNIKVIEPFNKKSVKNSRYSTCSDRTSMIKSQIIEPHLVIHKNLSFRKME
jgi:hypothetical protein